MAYVYYLLNETLSGMYLANGRRVSAPVRRPQASFSLYKAARMFRRDVVDRLLDFL